MSSLITSWQINGEKQETVADFIFLDSKITADSDCSHEMKRPLLLRRKTMTNLDSIFKKLRHYFAHKGPYSQCYGFSSSHIQMWELNHKEGWSMKELILSNYGAGEDSWESLDCKEIKPINPKGNQPWIFIGRTDAEVPILWPLDLKSWKEKGHWKRPCGCERLRVER